VNLGTPDSPKVPHVRKYLREFLMDGRVIDIAYPMRFLLVHGIIAPFRASQSAEAYGKIWTEAGSPLYVESRRLLEEVRRRVDYPVMLGMRYGSPAIAVGLRSLQDAGVERVTILPLFPHYAMSSYESAVEEAKAQAGRLGMDVDTVPPFYKNPGYISALTGVSRPYVARAEHVLFSFHGVPERHLTKSDPTGLTCLRSAGCCHEPNPAHNTCYRHQCLQTADRTAKALNLPEGSYSISFQSRLGRDPWLKPATDHHLEDLARRGVRRLAVICPSFTADCLETLEEIGIRGRNTFLAAGGEELTLAPCLNNDSEWAEEVVRMAAEADGGLPRGTLEKVSTKMTLEGSPEQVWRRMMTYEEVPGDPPWLLKMLIPVPAGTQGDKSRVGAEIQCRYRSGHLVKRITAVEPGQLMRFTVTEQHLGIEDRARAVEGTYLLREVAGGTEVTLTTLYRGFQHPRFLWRPVERYLTHELHRHILRGMRTAVTAAKEEKCPVLPSLSHR